MRSPAAMIDPSAQIPPLTAPLTAPWLTAPHLRAVSAAFAAADLPVFIVGGAVRNAILGLAAADIDMATPATPDQVVALLAAAGLKSAPTGAAHGTITAIAEHRGIEVTTFRADVITDGRHATVAFTTDIAEDAARRDFTMNALYADPEGRVIDPLGGLSDLLARRVRFIGAAEDRIREDYLRILRFFRFHAWYGDPDGGLDPDGLAACAALSDGIARLSRERVGAEMRKLLSARDGGGGGAGAGGAGGLGHAAGAVGASGEGHGRRPRLAPPRRRLDRRVGRRRRRRAGRGMALAQG
jgi:poly(A) polymerase